MEDGIDNVIGVGLDADIRLYMFREDGAVVTCDKVCCLKSLLKISFSESGANDQNDPRPSFAGRGTLTKA